MSKRILVVDDEEDIRDIVQLCLEDVAHWQAITASGAACLQLATAQPLDAILLDVSMPDIDGLQVFHELQTNTATRSIPVILLTAQVLPDELLKYSQMGVAGVITKPFNPAAISQQVADILGWNM